MSEEGTETPFQLTKSIVVNIVEGKYYIKSGFYRGKAIKKGLSGVCREGQGAKDIELAFQSFCDTKDGTPKTFTNAEVYSAPFKLHSSSNAKLTHINCCPFTIL
jgi:hypothetical protein